MHNLRATGLHHKSKGGLRIYFKLLNNKNDCRNQCSLQDMGESGLVLTDGRLWGQMGQSVVISDYSYNENLEFSLSLNQIGFLYSDILFSYRINLP